MIITASLLFDSTLNNYEKKQATSDYYKELSGIAYTQQQIGIFASGLDSIAAAHQVIYDNRNKMSGRELKNLLVSYESDLHNLIAQFNKLKK